jgi:hypothetical protein
MALAAVDPFYRAREEPPVRTEHVPHNLGRYLDALERMVRDEQAHMASARALGAAADAERVQAIRAAAANAERMASSVPTTSEAVPRIQRVREAADSLLSVVVRRPVHPVPSEEYWNEYLYDGLAVRAAASTEPEPVKEEATQPVVEAPVAEAPTMEAPALRQRRPAPEATEEKPGPPRLQSDRSLQDALASELLRMASVLKANTAAFSESLERDRVLVEEASGRLDQNLGLMTRTRGQLGVFSKKARSMGWFTIGSIVCVVVCWMLMFVVIRLT